MPFKKNKTDFSIVYKEINKALKNREFDYAIALYNKLEQSYIKLPEEKKQSYILFYTTIKDKLIILLKISELLNLVRTENLEGIRQRLNEIEYLTQKYRDTIPSRFFLYIKHNYKHAYKIYHYKLYKNQLDKVIEEIYSKLAEQNYEQALNLFPEAKKQFNHMSRYYKNDILFSELEGLKSHIKMSLLKLKAKSDPAEVDERKIRELIKKDLIGQSYGIIHPKKMEDPPKPKIKKTKKSEEKKINQEIKKIKQMIKNGEDKKSRRELNLAFKGI